MAADTSNMDCRLCLDALPTEVVKLVTDRLLPRERRSLFCTASMFGRQPTAQLVTHLCLQAGDLAFSYLQQAAGLSLVTAVKTLDLESADCHNLCSTSQLMLFCRLRISAMLQLTCLHLNRLCFSSVLTAAACLGDRSPPSLATIHLDTIFDDQRTSWSDVSQLWQALAGISSLRELKLCDMASFESGLPMEGLSALTSLRSLQLDNASTDYHNLPAMVALTQVCNHHL